METQKKPAKRLPNKIEALIPIVVLLAIMISNYAFGWGQDPPYSGADRLRGGHAGWLAVRL